MLFLSSLRPCLMFSDPSSYSLISLRVLNRHGLRVQRPTAAVRKRGELGGMFVSAGDRCCFIHICFVTVNREPLLLLNWHPEREPPPQALSFYIIRGAWSRGLASSNVTATGSSPLMTLLSLHFLSSRIAIRLLKWVCRRLFQPLLLFLVAKKKKKVNNNNNNRKNTSALLHYLEFLTGSDLHTRFFSCVAEAILSALRAELKTPQLARLHLARSAVVPKKNFLFFFLTLTTKNDTETEYNSQFQLGSKRRLSCRIVLYRIVSYRIVSNRVVLYRILLYRVVLYCIVSYRIVSSCIVLCRVVLYQTVQDGDLAHEQMCEHQLGSHKTTKCTHKDFSTRTRTTCENSFFSQG